MLTIKNLLHQYRAGRTTVRRCLTELYRAASEAPAGIWISLISEAQLEQYLARLERLSPDSLPLYGIPFAVKDNIDLAGIPTTAACRSAKPIWTSSRPGWSGYARRMA